MHTLSELGPSKLQLDEMDRIRQAADSLIFAEDLRDDPMVQVDLEDVETLCRDLVESGRWEQVTAMRLVSDVSQCGPADVPELKAA
jgi:hypothetical protein